jgi:Ca2+-binding EF-hand superfamily protein
MSFEESLELAKKELKNAFNTFDTDKSGTIERHELAQLLKTLTDAFDVEEPSDDDVNDILKELDDNGDGKISQVEFEDLIVEVVKIIEEEKVIKRNNEGS